METIEPIITPLTEASFEEGLRYLAKRDADLARILNTLGAPPMWLREAGFPTLVHIILEQQVSLASAKAAYDRLLAAASPLTPARFLELDDVALRAIGFSRQKTAYVRHLALSIVENKLDLDLLHQMEDTVARTELIKIKGIGSWTADIYLMMAMRHPDIWPKGDLALAIAVQKVKGLPARPTPDELEALSVVWKPWRAIAARLFWHFYLSKPVAS
jgi:DNA-3-methyladenine glycosylase II